MIKQFNRNRWNLAFFPVSELKDVLNGDYSSIKWMKDNNRSRWFADPFILSVNEDTIEVLVEEMTYNISRGRIAKLTIDKNTWELKAVKIILDQDTHLSFPMIYRNDNDVIIIPENSSSGKSKAYRYNTNNDELKYIKDVCECPLTDATILELKDSSYILSTSMPNCNSNVLSVYDFDRQSLKAQHMYDVEFGNNIARNAGSPFYLDGKLCRPAQDCDGGYGKRVIIQEISYKDGRLKFKNVGYIKPFTNAYNQGLHTLNQHHGYCVIDARGYLYPHIGRILRPIINILHKIGV